MSRHLAIEVLSSYLDEKLSAPKLRLVEEHLASCADCRERTDGLRAASRSVKRLEQIAPPETLGLDVQRTIRLEGRRSESAMWLEQVAGRRLSQPVLVPLLAIVLALGAILYLFAFALEQRSRRSTRMVVGSASMSTAERNGGNPPSDRPNSRLLTHIEGADFVLEGEGLVTPGLADKQVDVVVDLRKEAAERGLPDEGPRPTTRARVLFGAKVLDLVYEESSAP